MTNTFYGCELVTDQLPKELVQQLKVLSNYPLIKVPIRQKGITKGSRRECYWNANVINQSFGGKTIYGWAIDENSFSKKRAFSIHGHGNWLTPEGNLVDVTQLTCKKTHKDKKFRYFLPSDEVLTLNGQKRCSTIQNFYWAEDIEFLEAIVQEECRDMFTGFVNDNDLVKDDPELVRQMKENHMDITPFIFDKNHLTKDKKNLVLPLKTLLKINVFPHVVASWFDDMVFKDIPTDIVGKLFKENIEIVSENTNKQEFLDNRFKNFHDMVRQCMFANAGKSFEELQSVFEIANDYCHAGVFIRDWNTWEDVRYFEPTVSGISSATGKSIEEYKIHPEILKLQELPTDKSKRKEIINRAKNYKISPKEYLLLTNPEYFPHPYLAQKINYQKVKGIKQKTAVGFG